MKFRGLVHVIAAGAFCVTFSVAVKAQGCRIDELRFAPPDPQPKQKLALEFSVVSSSAAKVTIALYVQTDLNKNFRIDQDKGEIAKTDFTVNDNGAEDQNSAKNLFRIHVYDVPEGNPPLKYSAVAQCGPDRKSTSIKVPVQITNSDCATASPLRALLGTYCKPLAFSLGGIFEKRYASDTRVWSSIYVYSITEKKARLITHLDHGNVFTPRWSSDGKEIAFVLVNEASVVAKETGIQIGVIGSNGDGYTMLTSGAIDWDPIWSPDRRTILFLRNRFLHELEVATRQVKVLNDQLSLSRILGVVKKEQSTLLFCQGANLSVPDTQELYLLELDNEHRVKSVTQLVSDNRFYGLEQVAPDGEMIVFTRDDSLFITGKDQPTGEPIFSDNYKYRDPSWSPDGSRIVFVTNRP